MFYKIFKNNFLQLFFVFIAFVNSCGLIFSQQVWTNFVDSVSTLSSPRAIDLNSDGIDDGPCTTFCIKNNKDELFKIESVRPGPAGHFIYGTNQNGQFSTLKHELSTRISLGVLNMESGMLDLTNLKNDTYYQVRWYQDDKMDKGDKISVTLCRGGYTDRTGGFVGAPSLGFDVDFWPGHYGHGSGGSFWIINMYTARETCLGKVFSDGKHSYGETWLKGGLTYNYRSVNSLTPFIDTDNNTTTTESISMNTLDSEGWSDDRIKHNESKITNALDTINKMNVYRYIKTPQRMYNSDHHFTLDSSGNPLDENGNKILNYYIENGIIAQELETIDEVRHTVSNGNMVDESGNRIKQVKYNDLFCYNIAATQEIHNIQQADKAKIVELETKNASLEEKVSTLETKNTALEGKVSTLETTLSDLLTRIASLEGST